MNVLKVNMWLDALNMHVILLFSHLKTERRHVKQKVVFQSFSWSSFILLPHKGNIGLQQKHIENIKKLQ